MRVHVVRWNKIIDLDYIDYLISGGYAGYDDDNKIVFENDGYWVVMKSGKMMVVSHKQGQRILNKIGFDKLK